MSLLQEAMTDCIMLDPKHVEDGYGGFIITYEESVPFQAALVKDTSMQARIAEKDGVTSLYTVTTEKKITLQFYDVFKRLSDNKIFRITGDSTDKETPNSATLNMKQVSAEEWRLPNE